MDRSANTCAGICGSPLEKEAFSHPACILCTTAQPRLPFSPSPSYLYIWGTRPNAPKRFRGSVPLSLPPSSVRAPNWKTEAEEEASLPPGRREGGRRRRSDRIGEKRRRSRKEKKKLCFPLSSFSLSCGRAATVVFGDCFSSPSCLRFLPLLPPGETQSAIDLRSEEKQGACKDGQIPTLVCVSRYFSGANTVLRRTAYRLSRQQKPSFISSAPSSSVTTVRGKCKKTPPPPGKQNGPPPPPSAPERTAGFLSLFAFEGPVALPPHSPSEACVIIECRERNAKAVQKRPLLPL